MSVRPDFSAFFRRECEREERITAALAKTHPEFRPLDRNGGTTEVTG